MISDREILRAVKDLQARAPEADEEKILGGLKQELWRRHRLDPNAPPLSRSLRMRLYLREKRIGTLPVLLVVLAGALIVTGLATPADRAVAGWVAQLFETGQPGGSPSLTTPLPSPGAAERSAETSAVVLGTGVLNPARVRAELVVVETPEGENCVTLDLPASDFRLSGCSASTRPQLPEIKAVASTRPAGLPGVVVLGEAPAGTRSVIIAPAAGRAQPENSSEAEVFDPPAEIRARIGLTNHSAYFAAHLVAPSPRLLVATALNPSGEPIGTSKPFATQEVAVDRFDGDLVYGDSP